MRRPNKSTNAEQAAIEAAAELRLAGLRTKRVAAAEAALARAQQRLADAQQAEQQAAAQLAKHEWPGGRQRLLEARQEVEIATSLEVAHQRDLTSARARHTPQQRDAAIKLVKAEREAATLRPDIDPELEAIATLASQLVLHHRAVFDRVSLQYTIRQQQRDASDELGIPFDRSMVAAPDPNLLCAEGILKGCRAQDWSPFDWADIRPDRVMAPVLPLAGVQAVLVDRDEHAQRMRRWQDSLHAEAQGNDAINRLAEQEQEQAAQAESQARHDRATLAFNEMHRQAGGRR
jgi:hypothetical protein